MTARGPGTEAEPEITWHLDPSVWKRAHLGRCEAELWCIETGGATGWAVFGPGDRQARYQGAEPFPEQAQGVAERVLRACRAGEAAPGDLA